MVIAEMTGKELLEIGCEIISPSQKEARKNYLNSMKQRDGRHFTMMKRDNFKVIKENLTLQQHGVLLYLATCMKINQDGRLFSEKGDLLTVKHLVASLDKTRSQVNKILSELESNGLISRETVGKITYVDMTDAVFVCEKLKEEYKVVKIFKAHLQEKAKSISLNALGLFGMMLSYMSWNTNLLVENPDEEDTSKLVLLKRKHLEELLGLSRPTVKKLMNELGKNRLIVEIKSVTEAICLDPKAVSRQAKKITLEKLLDNIEKASFSKENFKK
ncbi:helix-turn-helix domain-containing protein [Bacillus sp. XF8]|uniref:MarR family transcriptional regulator n=1 Tax=Bacillus sp. XF8 TaxID=2819289 RepID=UPI001AA037A7|nr:helix-turn-helix domain-containing protein [Bacillus sp. XF8]MBO1579368.1 MarR family transcriptional regulator [Bacillus sp. XF8]